MSGNTQDGNAAPLLATEAALEGMLSEAATVSGQAQPAPSNSRLFTEEEIAAARRQEKDKLYPKLTELEQKLSLFEQEREEARRAAQEALDKEAQARREREEAEMSAKDLLRIKEDEFNQRINSVQQEWEQKLSAIQAENEAQKALLEQERRFQEVESHKQRRLAQESENIIPQLLTTIRGNSIEEIDAAISNAVEISSAIMQDIQQTLPQPQQRPRGISPVGGVPNGPLENSTEQQVLTTADIASMSIEQYAQVRDRLLASASGRGR